MCVSVLACKCVCVCVSACMRVCVCVSFVSGGLGHNILRDCVCVVRAVLVRGGRCVHTCRSVCACPLCIVWCVLRACALCVLCAVR